MGLIHKNADSGWAGSVLTTFFGDSFEFLPYAEMGLAKRLEATLDDIISTIHAHPTMAESIHEAVLATENRAIHA